MKKLLSVLFMAAAAMAQADQYDPVGVVNLATSSGAKTTKCDHMHTSPSNQKSLFDGNRNRWLGKKADTGKGEYATETITFTEKSPIVNAYRVLRGTDSSDTSYKQARAAQKWDFWGKNDGDDDWTLLHEQTTSVTWYDSTGVVRDYFDCQFENTTAYSTYRFRVTENGGNTYVALDDVRLYRLERADTLAIENNGFDVGEPSPAYGAMSGLKEGDTVELKMAETRVVNPTTSRRYELTGFTIKYSDGTVVKEGKRTDIPYTYTHGARAATVVWNWSDPLAEFAAVATPRVDLTVFEDASSNEITDGRLDGEAMEYMSSGTRAKNGPQRLFDDNTTGTSWAPAGTTPYYAQYTFKSDDAEVRRFVTGVGVIGYEGSYNHDLMGFDFEASNDGISWKKLLSVRSPVRIVSNVWDFANNDAYSRYRFVVTSIGNTRGLEVNNLEFYSYRGNDVLEILGAPAYGQPDPDYGVVTNLTTADTLTLKAPSAEVVVSENEKAVCTGYTLTVDGEDPIQGQGTTCAYAHVGKGTTLTWNFSSSYRHRVGVKGAGSVDCPAEAFVPVGTPMTITATPESDDEPFLEWQGDVPEGQTSNPVLTFTADRPRLLTAVFAAPIYVSATGDDANDGSSWAQAVATVARGWELCGGAGKMYLGEGEFSVTSGLLNVTHSLQINGMGPDKTTLLADNEGAASVPFMTLGNSRAVVTGVRVKGAQLASGNGAGILLTAGTVTNCCVDSCSTTGYGGGVWMEETGMLVDTVITNCSAGQSAGGVYVKSGLFLRNLVADCRGKDCGGAFFRSAITVVDSIFRGNTASGNGGAVGCDSASVLFTNCVFVANSASNPSGVIDSCPVQVVFDNCLFTDNQSKSWGGVGSHFGGVIRHSRLIGNTGKTGTRDFGGVLYLEGAAKVENCLVFGNNCGKGVFYMDDAAAILNCTIVSNRCDSDGAIRMNSGSVCNSIVADNYSVADGVVSNWTGVATRATYSCIAGHDPAVLGTGSISADPKFVGTERGDYTLKPSSPCVNAGANSYVKSGDIDLAGNPRIYRFGGKAKYDVVDMGCYESPYARKPGLQILVR